MDFSLPTKRGTTICGKIITSLKGSKGTRTGRTEEEELDFLSLSLLGSPLDSFFGSLLESLLGLLIRSPSIFNYSTCTIRLQPLDCLKKRETSIILNI
jgi:hypothetical protein